MPEHGGNSDEIEATSEQVAEKTDSNFLYWLDPQKGGRTEVSNSEKRTRISDSFEQSWQLNSKIGMNSITGNQEPKAIAHRPTGINCAQCEKGSKSPNDHVLSLFAFEKLRLFFHRTDHDDRVNDYGENRHGNHKPIEFSAHILHCVKAYSQVKTSGRNSSTVLDHFESNGPFGLSFISIESKLCLQ